MILSSDHFMMKPCMKEMLRTIANRCVLILIFLGEFINSDQRPNVIKGNRKSHMTKWLKTMFLQENRSCDSAKLRNHDFYLKSNERNCGNDDQYGQPSFNDKKIRSQFYQVCKPYLIDFYY